MINGKNPKFNIKNFIVTIIATCIIKAVIDFLSTFILSIPFGEEVEGPFIIYLVPSVGVFAALAIWILHNRLQYGHFKIGLYIAIISAVVIQALITPWIYNLPGEDLQIMLSWGLSFLSLIIAVVLSKSAYLWKVK